MAEPGGICECPSWTPAAVGSRCALAASAGAGQEPVLGLSLLTNSFYFCLLTENVGLPACWGDCRPACTRHKGTAQAFVS